MGAGQALAQRDESKRRQQGPLSAGTHWGLGESLWATCLLHRVPILGTSSYFLWLSGSPGETLGGESRSGFRFWQAGALVLAPTSQLRRSSCLLPPPTLPWSSRVRMLALACLLTYHVPSLLFFSLCSIRGSQHLCLPLSSGPPPPHPTYP